MSAVRVPANGTALTTREAEVLELVRQRLSNAEIAELLSVSVRTVETHVSALLRKIGVDDRRALAQHALSRNEAPTTPPVRLPATLTPFVGRAVELEQLCEAVRNHRLVVATGPGGVGKTRLALEAARQLSASFSDGSVFVDLVRVVQPSMVVAAIADACGVPERAVGTREEALTAALNDRDLLLLIDNCEHVQDAARMVIERLLTACPTVRILATSRLRLMLPFERVIAVDGLSLVNDAGASDAVTLFVDRMTAAGATAPTTPTDRELVREICDGLDGMALSIELAAARAPSLGLDGLLTALRSNLRILSVGTRADDRHRSLHAAIDWSYDLLDREAQQVLRAATVFVGPFDLQAICAVAELPQPAVVDAVARLVDWNLISLRSRPSGRYGVLETIRQYAFSLDTFADEAVALRARHGAWCRSKLVDLLDRAPGDEFWCAEVDAVIDDARAALDDLQSRVGGADGASFAGLLADVTFQRGLPGEAQRGYENAAAMTESLLGRRGWLHLAAGAAAARNVGGETVDLLVDASQLAIQAGRPDDAATDLANAAGLQFRAQGIIHQPVNIQRVQDLLTQARSLHQGGAEASAALAVAQGWSPDADARSREDTEQALRLAESSGRTLLIDEALDQFCALQLSEGNLSGAATTIQRRLDLLAAVPVDARSGFEHYDSLHMACQVSLAVGRLEAARRFADAITALPFFRQERHLGLGRRLSVDALAGDVESAMVHADLFERDWHRSGRPVAGNLAVGAYATAMVFGVHGDDERRTHWIDITQSLLTDNRRLHTSYNMWRVVFDGLLALHRDDLMLADELLSFRPGPDVPSPSTVYALWESWYAAVWAETGVLTGQPDASDRLEHARHLCSANGVALAIVERAAALHEGRIGSLDAIAARLTDLGCRYQADRTRLLAERASARGRGDRAGPP
jgi:predicted ATPase/DNA-binding CsgD family transcriptional regulator